LSAKWSLAMRVNLVATRMRVLHRRGVVEFSGAATLIRQRATEVGGR
jgi:hypothetical protein